MMCGRAAGLMMRPCDIQQLTTALRWKGCAWIRPQPHPRHYGTGLQYDTVYEKYLQYVCDIEVSGAQHIVPRPARNIDKYYPPQASYNIYDIGLGAWSI